MRHTPLLKTIVTLSALAATWGPQAYAEDRGLTASTLMERTVIGASSESTLGNPAAEFVNTAAGSFDPSLFVVLSFGLAGLFWIRRYVRTL